MKKSRLLIVAGLLLAMTPFPSKAQDKNVKYTVLGQFWGRYNQYNPGSTIDGSPKTDGFDVGIRRFRAQVYSQINERVFLYSQVGINNFNSLSDRKAGFFLHDALGEYAIAPTKLSLGMGLTAWSGLSRFASPSAGTILGIDTPLYQQSTGDQTDQFLRKLSIYTKGKLGKVDYRLALSHPMSYAKAMGAQLTPGKISNFAYGAPKAQWNGYFQYQFLESEGNTTPYMSGTYLGKKRVATLGAGFVHQSDAMWRKDEAEKTIRENMTQLSTDFFLELPTKTNGEAVNFYANVAHFDYGKGYLRNQATMNPTNGLTSVSTMNGSGNGYPSYGTGTVAYVQGGYKLKDNLIGKTTLFPYASYQFANYKRLNDNVNYIDLGINWLLAGNSSKLTVSYQNRPVFDLAGNKDIRKGAVALQYQVMIQ